MPAVAGEDAQSLFWPGEPSGPACKRRFRKLVGAEDLLQVVDALAEGNPNGEVTVIYPFAFHSTLTDRHWFLEELLTRSAAHVPYSKPRLRVPLCPVPASSPRHRVSFLRL